MDSIRNIVVPDENRDNWELVLNLDQLINMLKEKGVKVQQAEIAEIVGESKSGFSEVKNHKRVNINREMLTQLMFYFADMGLIELHEHGPLFRWREKSTIKNQKS